MRRSVFVGVLAMFLCEGGILTAQDTPRPDAVRDPIVVEKLVERHTFDTEGVQTSTSEVRLRVQSAAALDDVGTIALPYRRASSTLTIEYVRVRKASGAIVETPVSSAIDTPAEITRSNPTFSDLYFRHVNVQGLSVGDTLEYATSTRTESLIPGQFWFENELGGRWATTDAEISVTVPVSRAPLVKHRGVAPTVSTAGDVRTYVWRASNLEAPDERAWTIRAFASRNERPAIQVTSFKSWEEVGRALQNLWATRADPTPAIQAKARALTEGSADDEERIRRLYKFVATEIRYVAIEFGVGAIQPHPADDVLANGFGDCKDKHVLLTALLGAVGIPAHAAIIGPGMGFDADIPSLAPFDHVITNVPRPAGAVWLDATLGVAPYGQLIANERDRDVLLLPRHDPPRLAKTPTTSPNDNLIRVLTEGTLEPGGTLRATVSQTFSGDAELVMRTLFRAYPPAQWPTIAMRTSLPARFGGTVSEVVATPPDDIDVPFRVTFKYTSDTLSAWAKHQLIAPLTAVSLAVIPETPEPAVPVDTFAGKIVETARIQLPMGFRAGAPAAPVTLESAFGTYRYTASVTSNVFTAERELTQTRAMIPVADFSAYRSFRDKTSEMREYITLTELKAWAFNDSPTIDWYGLCPSEAESELRKATGVAERKEFPAALTAASAVTTREPRLACGWLILAWIQTQSGNVDAAVESMRQQLAAAPTASGHKYLAMSLARLGRRDDALAAWAAGRAAYPDDPEFALYLGSALLGAKRFAEAASVLETEADTQQKSVRFLRTLGEAYLDAGRVPEGIARLTASADLDSSPGNLNEVAWRFADRAVALDAAVTMAKAAIDKTEADVARLEPASIDAAGLRLHDALAAYWDTLAWAHFKKKELEPAERYARAAWQLGGLPVLARHLGDIQGARGLQREQVDMYLASSVVGLTSADLARRQQSPEAAQSLAAALKQVRDAASVNVRRVEGAEGLADAFVLVSSDGVVQSVRVLGSDPVMAPQFQRLQGVVLPFRAPSPAVRVVRRGVMTCLPDAATCQFRLLSTAEAIAATR